MVHMCVCVYCIRCVYDLLSDFVFVIKILQRKALIDRHHSQSSNG